MRKSTINQLTINNVVCLDLLRLCSAQVARHVIKIIHRRWTLLLIVSLLIVNSSALALGQAGQDIAVLKAGVGARPLGMGSAFVAISDNADAPFWNPAGLAKIDFSEITTMQTRLSTDADHYYISYVRPFLNGALGISWIQIGIGDIEKTASPESDTYNEVVKLGVFSYYSNAYMVSYGTNLTDKLSFGLTAKYLTNDMYQIEEGQAYGFSLTPGLLYKPNYHFSLGLKIDEVLNHQKWGTGTVEQVPPKIRLGLAYKIHNPGLTISADVSQIAKIGYSPEFYFGSEYIMSLGKKKDNLAIRLGYAKNTLTGGVGFTDKHIEINYAYVAQQALSKNNVHRISLSGKW